MTSVITRGRNDSICEK